MTRVLPERRRNLRLPKFNYREGWFFITNKTNFSNQYFNGDIYKIVKDELFQLPIKYPGVKVDFFSILPTHIHVILIFDKSDLPLPEIWRRFKAVTTLYARRSGFPRTTLWQSNFYEHIIRNEAALERIRKYIVNNPLKIDLPLDEIYTSYKDYQLILN